MIVINSTVSAEKNTLKTGGTVSKVFSFQMWQSDSQVYFVTSDSTNQPNFESDRRRFI